jgi:hypothetical protein
MIFLLLQDLKSELSSANTTSAEFPNTIELSVENVCKKNNIFQEYLPGHVMLALTIYIKKCLDFD